MRFHRRDFLDLMTFGECRRQMFSELFGLLVDQPRGCSFFLFPGSFNHRQKSYVPSLSSR